MDYNMVICITKKILTMHDDNFMGFTESLTWSFSTQVVPTTAEINKESDIYCFIASLL